ncbi:MAG: glucose-6-phosphate isomerase [Bacteroidales bacterium]|jgi:glucose-6-phosphate isomerase|nr:glucose-6-phosphate isomerase [Bacteroidales bacterium]
MKIDFFQITGNSGKGTFSDYCEKALERLEILNSGKGSGNDFLGWINLPQSYDDDEIKDIIETAGNLRELDIIVIIGIGGSYLGAKAIIEALKPQFEKTSPEIIFAGHNLCGNYHSELIDYLTGKKYGLIVISKSGTTTEPAIAFRLLLHEMKNNFSAEEIRKRVIAITDAEKGALKELADKEGFKTFIIPDNVGGRYSVLTPVGLLPVAVAGFDIESLLHGSSIAQNICLEYSTENPAVKYAAFRNLMYDSGKKTELLVNYNLRLNFFTEWWKQLFGESEGKENKGIFPASASFTTDLHSLGQYIQQGERTIFETVIFVNNQENDTTFIPVNADDNDNLNYLAGKNMEYVNTKAAEGTLIAHLEGGVPNIRIEIDNLDEYNLGFLLYFFEISCGISGYMLNINPFDQPGVEDYKRNMFKLLRKNNR